MRWFSTIFHKNRRLLNYILAAVFLLLVTIINDPVRISLAKISASVFYSPFFRLKSHIQELQNVAEENRFLRRQLTETSLQLVWLNEARRENQRLRELLGFEPPENFRLVPVKIVSLYQQIYPVAAIVNKGSDDGIRANLAVVNRYGLAGKIVDVMTNYATVQLLTDPSNAVSGRVGDSRQIGIVRFSPQRGLYMDNLPADAQVKKGDLIISSGLGGIYPPGLAIAQVDSVYANAGEILKRVNLRPAVNFFEIDELYVLMED
ncbi:MAG: rod shape-determining protein MreC [bacterium]|jgi:rod shape-determining protein MreC